MTKLHYLLSPEMSCTHPSPPKLPLSFSPCKKCGDLIISHVGELWSAVTHWRDWNTPAWYTHTHTHTRSTWSQIKWLNPLLFPDTFNVPPTLYACDCVCVCVYFSTVYRWIISIFFCLYFIPLSLLCLHRQINHPGWYCGQCVFGSLLTFMPLFLFHRLPETRLLCRAEMIRWSLSASIKLVSNN